MAGCSFERALQTIRSPLQRISAFSRLFSTVRGYNHPIPATGPRTPACSKLHGRQPHGYLTSLTGRATMIRMNSLIRSINIPCSYSALRHCRRCIHSTSSESFRWKLYHNLYRFYTIFKILFQICNMVSMNGKIPNPLMKCKPFFSQSLINLCTLDLLILLSELMLYLSTEMEKDMR